MVMFNLVCTKIYSISLKKQLLLCALCLGAYVVFLNAEGYYNNALSYDSVPFSSMSPVFQFLE